MDGEKTCRCESGDMKIKEYKEELESAVAWADSIVAGRRRSKKDCIHLAFLSRAVKDYMGEV